MDRACNVVIGWVVGTMVILVGGSASVSWAQFPQIPNFPSATQIPSAQPATVQSVIGNLSECAGTVVISNSCLFGTLAVLAYWAPTHWCEVTGKTGVPVVQGQTPLQVGGQALLPTPNPILSGGGASTGTGDGQTNRHFKEARCYAMPTSLSRKTCGICDGESLSSFQLNYVSDLDEEWRTLTTPAIPGITGEGPPLGVLDFGVWGPIYPRQGVVIHGSEVVAAAHAAARAMHIASQPVELPPSTTVRPVLAPAPPPSCFQMAHPIRSQCVPPGASPIYFETFRLELEGKYVFVMWTVKACCVDEGTARACEQQNLGFENFCAAGVGPLGIVPGAIPFR